MRWKGVVFFSYVVAVEEKRNVKNQNLTQGERKKTGNIFKRNSQYTSQHSFRSRRGTKVLKFALFTWYVHIWNTVFFSENDETCTR